MTFWILLTTPRRQDSRVNGMRMLIHYLNRTYARIHANMKAGTSLYARTHTTIEEEARKEGGREGEKGGGEV